MTRLNILYVEDHADTAEVFAALLRRWSHTVTVATTIAMARSLLKDGRYDLLLCDLKLPDGNGNDLVRELGDTLPMNAVAISGFSTNDEIAEARTAGFQSYLVKPIKIDALKALLESITAR